MYYAQNRAEIVYSPRVRPCHITQTRLLKTAPIHDYPFSEGTISFFQFWVVMRPKDTSDTTRVSFILGRENNAMVDDFQNVVETGNDSSLSHNMQFGIYK